MDRQDERISHSRADESIEAKTLWFSSLPLRERMVLLCEFTELALAVNPGLLEQSDAEPPGRRVLVLSTP